MTTHQLQPKVELGDRIYRGMTWTRKDTIYLGDIKIGYIHSSRENRKGMTVSAFGGERVEGRAIQWCASKAHEVIQSKGTDTAACRLSISN